MTLNQAKNPIKKQTKPTSLDKYEVYTLWEVIATEDTPRQIYIQLSEDIHKPHWEPLGKILEHVFYSCRVTKRFIPYVIDLFKRY